MESNPKGLNATRPWRRWALALFALTLLVFTKSEPLSWADASRLGTIQGLVEHQTLALDNTAYLWQGDKVFVDGHYYSHQPPMMALLGALPYAALHAVGRAIDDPGTYRILTWVLVGLPLWLGLAALGRLARRFGASELEAGLAIALAGLTTLALPYALVLNQHGLAAGLVLLGVEAIVHRRFARAGFVLSLAATVDLTALFMAAALALAVVWAPRDPDAEPALKSAPHWRALGPYFVWALPPIALYLGINQAIVGDFKPVGLHTEAFQYPLSPFVLMSLTGGGDSGPAGTLAAYATGALVGTSGLFLLSPALLLAVWAGLRAGVRGPARSLALAILLGSAGIVTFYIVSSRNFGGSSFGMRWFTVFAPALWLLPALAGRWPGRAWLTTLALPSLAFALLGAVQPWAKFHWRYEDSPEGRVAAANAPRPDRIEFLQSEWARIRNLDEVFTEARFDTLYQKLIDQHRSLYLQPLPGLDPAVRRAWITEGLLKLQAATDLLNRDNSKAATRPVAHFWLGKFHAALGDRSRARREYEITLGLAPHYVWAQKALEDLDREKAAANAKSGH